MSIFDTILKGIGGAPDDVANLSAKLGIDPGLAEKAIAALGQSHQMQGDTVELAAAKTGLPASTLQQIVQAVGGEGSLMEFANILDRDKDGSAFDDIADIAKGLFGKK
ncbi:MAG: hypothetical protein WCY92_04605 [Novosphingobium sp.]|uniref:hypothetical protein n=1 Tax=Tsuneonella sp. CC-YZS046 TaxID=3042152 RepID=UPI002D78FFC7|nr:hypothetical protein [Tsuneonella sp. CC-YZS046]WRO65137.1 hypothetical protein U8326_08590 [Tsuneonella sp. CC-YZS046]